MTDIDISHNRISGPLNATWDALPSLATLDASHNALNGSLPLSLFRAPALTALLLQANSLSGALPVPQGTPENTACAPNAGFSCLQGSYAQLLTLAHEECLRACMKLADMDRLLDAWQSICQVASYQ